MSEKLGSVRYAGPQLQYLGGAMSDMSQLSPQTRDTIDSEIKRIVDTQFERAQRLLAKHRTALDTLMADLLKAETLDGSVVRLALERSPAAA
jgi:cell division protease FtsH